MKTYSARQLSLYMSLLLAAVTMIFLIVEHYFDSLLLSMIVLLPIFFGLTYIVVLYILNHYIYHKIVPIYKTIRSTPLDEKKRLKLEESGSNIISSVNQEVKAWAKTKEKEIARLRDLEQYRKEFVGNVSHELKTPIFNIQGYILTLLEGGLEDSKVNRFYLERSVKSIDRMISIVEDLESITKLESGELKLQQKQFDVTRLVDDVFELHHMLAKQNKIDLEIYTKVDRPINVIADKKRMFEVINNLVANGIKYGKRRGYVKVGFFDMDEHILVEVSDNGIGIEEKDISRVFERFYRADKSRSREQGGTGLGLSIVKHIIEAHGQTINVKSVPDQGTTFTFTIDKALVK
ncbi:sensor histidine kinase [Puteibacter caeruleilacunae]|nr:sensor histidine kinase [Puteibacter caeruleilacunae]